MMFSWSPFHNSHLTLPSVSGVSSLLSRGKRQIRESSFRALKTKMSEHSSSVSLKANPSQCGLVLWTAGLREWENVDRLLGMGGGGMLFKKLG